MSNSNVSQNTDLTQEDKIYFIGNSDYLLRPDDVANIGNSLSRLATGERLQGIIDFAIAIGLKVIVDERK